MTTSIAVELTPPVRYVLRWADTCLIHAQRLSEWCGHGPVLEEDIALANISLDQIGQARLLYQLAAARIQADAALAAQHAHLQGGLEAGGSGVEQVFGHGSEECAHCIHRARVHFIAPALIAPERVRPGRG